MSWTRVRSGPAARMSTVIILTSVVGQVLAACEGKTYSCQGSISRTCESLASEDCARSPGCVLAAVGRCASWCASNTNQPSCTNSLCIWDAGQCNPPCSTLDVAKCATDSECVVVGKACVNRCSSIQDESGCAAQPSCHWMACSGVPKGPCSAYSGDDCPTILGCDRVVHYPYSTQ
jgi:hypothetical protein